MGVAASAVSQNEAIVIGRFRDVEESSDVWVDGIIGELADGRGGQVNILNSTAILSGMARTLRTIP